MGAKRRLNGTSKVNTQTDGQTHGHTDGHFNLKKASAQRVDALKIFALKFVQVGYKRQKSFFSNKYCDLAIHASFTKFTNPAKLFLNNDIFYFHKKKLCGDF